MPTLPPRPPVVFLGDDALEYTEQAPGPELAPWVQSFWRIRCRRATTLRVPPDGCMDVINDDLVGSLSSGLVADLYEGEDTFGVRFRPGGFTALYGVPADELTDIRVPLTDVVGKARSLRALARDADWPDPVSALALAQPDVKALAQETGWSERHLRRRVLAATGHSPRRLARIGRMQAMLTAVHGGRGPVRSWSRTAAEFGYYDEAHMINDVRALTGATPNALVGPSLSRDPSAADPSRS